MQNDWVQFLLNIRMRTKSEYGYILSKAKYLTCYKLLGGKCNRCGFFDVACMNFHHVDKNDKEYGISDIISSRLSKTLVELEKCMLLCDNCHNEIHSETSGKSNKTHIKNKLKLLDMYGKHQCEECCYNKNVAALHFHHKNPSEKLFTFSNKSKFNESEMRKELDKCVLLCGNCHNKVHFNYERYYKNFEAILEKSNNFIKKDKVDEQLVLDLHESGLTYREISDKLNCAKSSITYILNKNGIDVKKIIENRTISEQEEIIKKYIEGWSVDSLSAFFNKTKQTIFKILKNTEKRDDGGKYKLTKDVIIDLLKKYSVEEIAKNKKCAINTIYERCKVYGIKMGSL